MLFVDDEPIVRRSGELLLTRLGYRGLLARHGREALRIFRENTADVFLVILDLFMPEMGGEETLIELRKLTPAVCVLLSSGCRDNSIHSSGADGFLPKPYGLKDLAEALERFRPDVLPSPVTTKHVMTATYWMGTVAARIAG